MKQLDVKEIKKIEQFMEDEAFDSVDYMLACFDRLREFARETIEKLNELDNKGDLE